MEETIFSKLDLRREVLATLHKQVEECSQQRAHYNIVYENYLSIENDEEAKEAMSADDIMSIQTECDRLRIHLEEKKMQVASDIDNYVNSTSQFLLDSYQYVRMDNCVILYKIISSSVHCFPLVIPACTQPLSPNPKHLPSTHLLNL